MNANFRNFALWVIIGLVLIALFNLFQNTGQRTVGHDISYSQFISEVEQGRIRNVVIAGPQIAGTYSDNTTFQTFAPDDPDLIKRLEDRGVQIAAKPATEGGQSLVGMLVSWFPMFLILAVWIFFMRQMQSGSGRAMGFGKSKAKLLTERHGRVTFEDVAGVDEAKDDLQEIVEFLRDPQKFQRLGGRIPRGCLLVGPPGTGKTLLARA
ncbi:MAG: ATP-dependent metallopeptidase FtsH/Yme1/Tma family protein, partial [Bauldia sp.]|nr:ATP-dependent metallopeptidase FtsH/Yme1/Tma family protein [Bauldia sp.]